MVVTDNSKGTHSVEKSAKPKVHSKENSLETKFEVCVILKVFFEMLLMLL